MTHYSANPGIVRCDVFKPGGKWYETIELDMSDYYNKTITPFMAVAAALEEMAHYQIGDWNFFVSEPYHHRAYPVMIPSTVNVSEFMVQMRKEIIYVQNQNDKDGV